MPFSMPLDIVLRVFFWLVKSETQILRGRMVIIKVLRKFYLSLRGNNERLGWGDPKGRHYLTQQLE